MFLFGDKTIISFERKHKPGAIMTGQKVELNEKFICPFPLDCKTTVQTAELFSQFQNLAINISNIFK